MNIISVILAFFSFLGAVDRIIGNRFGIGREFERGFNMLGTLTMSMLGMIILSPVIATLLQPIINYLPIDPSMVMGVLFANDMGGAHLAVKAARDSAAGLYNGLVVASMMGCTISFTIPFALNSVKKEHHREVLLGLLCGIVTIPVGCIVSAFISGLPLMTMFINLAPLVVVSTLIAWALMKFPEGCVKFFSFLGNVIRTITTIGLFVGVTGFLSTICFYVVLIN